MGTSYVRRIVYFSEYLEDEIKANAGFGKMEAFGEEFWVQFSIRADCDTGWKGYCYAKKENEVQLIFLGDLKKEDSNWVLTIATKADNIKESGVSFEEINGILVMENDAHYCSEEPFSGKKELEKSEISEDWADKLFLELPEMYPFEDDEMERCVRLEPKDFGRLPTKDWQIARNTFLLEAYYTYRHLVFAKKTEEGKPCYYLGVPGVFHRRDCFLANMFGFSYFKGIHKKEDKVGDFGYWFKRLD